MSPIHFVLMMSVFQKICESLHTLYLKPEYLIIFLDNNNLLYTLKEEKKIILLFPLPWCPIFRYPPLLLHAVVCPVTFNILYNTGASHCSYILVSTPRRSYNGVCSPDVQYYGVHHCSYIGVSPLRPIHGGLPMLFHADVHYLIPVYWCHSLLIKTGVRPPDVQYIGVHHW